MQSYYRWEKHTNCLSMTIMVQTTDSKQLTDHILSWLFAVLGYWLNTLWLVSLTKAKLTYLRSGQLVRRIVENKSRKGFTFDWWRKLGPSCLWPHHCQGEKSLSIYVQHSRRELDVEQNAIWNLWAIVSDVYETMNGATYDNLHISLTGNIDYLSIVPGAPSLNY